MGETLLWCLLHSFVSSCSKLTMLLVNERGNFQTTYSTCKKKDTAFFFFFCGGGGGGARRGLKK